MQTKGRSHTRTVVRKIRNFPKAYLKNRTRLSRYAFGTDEDGDRWGRTFSVNFSDFMTNNVRPQVSHIITTVQKIGWLIIHMIYIHTDHLDGLDGDLEILLNNYKLLDYIKFIERENGQVLN